MFYLIITLLVVLFADICWGCYKLYSVEGWKSRNILLSFAGCAIMDLLVIISLVWSQL